MQCVVAGSLRPLLAGERLMLRFIGELAERLDDPGLDRNEVCRDALATLYGLPLNAAGAEDDTLPLATRLLYSSFDPRNITLEPEYYADVDREQYARVKPLTWLWLMFDRSPHGQSAFFGHLLRRMLAERVFRRCGRNVKIWQFVEYSYGYNLSVGDDVVLHRYAFLDDRGGIELGNHVSVSDYANIYSHTHDINDRQRVYLRSTRIGDHVRITYHATVLAGVGIGRDGLLGAMGIATRSLPGDMVSVGVPARPVREKNRPCPYCVDGPAAATYPTIVLNGTAV